MGEKVNAYDLELGRLTLGQAADIITSPEDDLPVGTGVVDPTEVLKSEEQQICEALGGSWVGGACQGVETIEIQKTPPKGPAPVSPVSGKEELSTRNIAITVALSAIAVGGLVYLLRK